MEEKEAKPLSTLSQEARRLRAEHETEFARSEATKIAQARKEKTERLRALRLAQK